MKVIKTINNNVVSCLDDNRQELVVMGRGLGFGVKPGEALPPERIEKVFRMDSPEQVRKLKDLFEQLPPELLDLCSRIIDYATQVLGRRLNHSVYLTLTDHIQFAIERCRQQMPFPNVLSTEVQVFCPEEYAIGRHARDLILSELGVELPEDEAASIALHIVNAEYNSSMSLTMRATHTLTAITAILASWPGLRLDREHLGYSELLIHLKFMAMQAFTQGAVFWNDDRLSQSIKPLTGGAFGCAGAICTYISEQSGTEISASEQAFLALCIRRACR